VEGEAELGLEEGETVQEGDGVGAAGDRNQDAIARTEEPVTGNCGAHRLEEQRPRGDWRAVVAHGAPDS
jgi:hypothetical protein